MISRISSYSTSNMHVRSLFSRKCICAQPRSEDAFPDDDSSIVHRKKKIMQCQSKASADFRAVSVQ